MEATQAELLSLLTSHTGLITNFRSALAEYSEDHKQTQRHVRDLSEEIGRMGERIAENTEPLQNLREEMHGLADVLAGVREAVMRSSPPYRSPPTAGPQSSFTTTEQGIPIRLDEAIRAATTMSSQPPVLYSVGAGQRGGEPTPTVDTNLLLLRILEQMTPGHHMMPRRQ